MYVATTSIEYVPQISKGVIKKYFHVGCDFLNSTTIDRIEWDWSRSLLQKTNPRFLCGSGG
jgi:hypothetical protein